MQPETERRLPHLTHLENKEKAKTGLGADRLSVMRGLSEIIWTSDNKKYRKDKTYHKVLVSIKIKTEHANAHEQCHEGQGDAVLVFQSPKADT